MNPDCHFNIFLCNLNLNLSSEDTSIVFLPGCTSFIFLLKPCYPHPSFHLGLPRRLPHLMKFVTLNLFLQTSTVCQAVIISLTPGSNNRVSLSQWVLFALLKCTNLPTTAKVVHKEMIWTQNLKTSLVYTSVFTSKVAPENFNLINIWFCSAGGWSFKLNTPNPNNHILHNGNNV